MNSIFEIFDKSIQYLTNREQPNFNGSISYSLIAAQQKSALTTGYIAALHMHRFYNRTLFSTVYQCDDQILEDLSQHTAINDVLEAHEALGMLCAGDPEDKSQKDLFILGYRAGLHITGQYDDCFFLEGYMLECSIMSSLILFQKKREDAQRAQARIIMQYANGNYKEQLRAMIIEDGEPIPHSDNTQPIITATIKDSEPLPHSDSTQPIITATIKGQPIPSEGNNVHGAGSPCHIDTATDPA